MPKKKSSRKSKLVADESSVGDKKQSSTPKRPNKEIDEIFAGKKRKNPEQEKSKKPAEEVGQKRKKLKNKETKGEVSEEHVEHSSKPRKTTKDGLALYTEEELGIGKADAGGSALCPFDCDCCF